MQNFSGDSSPIPHPQFVKYGKRIATEGLFAVKAEASTDSVNKLGEYLSPAGAWAFALGTSIGWGSFVITSNTYLLGAGPAGSVLGMLVGAVVMLVIARNYHYLMNRHPDAGGAYSYATHAFGHDYGFLTAWFLGLTYLAILWANATSIPLFARYFVGDFFQSGFHYSLFGYDIYFSEALLSIAALLFAGALCIGAKRFASGLMIGLAVAIVVGICLCFGVSIAGVQGQAGAFDPAFAPDGNALAQVVMIACISPWAFIGFESISQSTEEFSFSRTKSFKVLVTAVVMTTALYIFVTLLSVTAYPPQFDSWYDYIGNLGSLQGIEGLPAFYAASCYLGDAGVSILYVVLFALIVTSLIGNITALSRLVFALARDSILPGPLASLNRKGIPYKAIGAIVAVSCIVPFLGRTAIGWIVDVTTIGATITYGFVSAAAIRTARRNHDRVETWTGIAGLAIMIVMGALLVLPNLFASSSLAQESYFLFITWSLLGLIFFHRILRRDPEKRFGDSVVVWIALLAFVMFMSFVWMEERFETVSTDAMTELRAYYEEGTDADGTPEDADRHFSIQLQKVHAADMANTFVVLCLFALSFGVMISNYSYMRRKQLEDELLLEVERMRADTDPLTGVKNKTAYVERELDISMRIENGTMGPFALGVFDLNDLKVTNDTLGHAMGDELIREACKVVCDTFKRSPVFRTGGDEFVVIADGADYPCYRELLESLLAISRENCQTGGVVIAGGMTEFDPEHDNEVQSVFRRADELMYEQKAALKELAAAPAQTKA